MIHSYPDVDHTGPEYASSTSDSSSTSKPVVVGFDILLTPEQARLMEAARRNPRRHKRKALSSLDFHWPKGIIPYVIAESVGMYY
jgi:hypothetical protein